MILKFKINCYEIANEIDALCSSIDDDIEERISDSNDDDDCDEYDEELRELSKSDMSADDTLEDVSYDDVFVTFSEYLIKEYDTNKLAVIDTICFLTLLYYEDFYNDVDNFFIDSLDDLDSSSIAPFVLEEYPNIFFHLMNHYDNLNLLSLSNMIVRRETVIEKSGKDKEFFTKYRPEYFTELSLLKMRFVYENGPYYSLIEDLYVDEIDQFDNLSIEDCVRTYKNISKDDKPVMFGRMWKDFLEYTEGKQYFTKLSIEEITLLNMIKENETVNLESFENSSMMNTLIQGYLDNSASYFEKKFPNHNYETDHIAIEKTFSKKKKDTI